MEPRSTAIRTYLLTYLALMGLFALTWALAYLDLGAGNAIAGFAIAAAKALLVGIVFMHLRTEQGPTRIYAVAGIGWLLILLSLGLSDYLSRHWMLLPGAWPGNSPLN